MVVKSVRGRRRYIAFTVSGDISRTVLINRMNVHVNAPYVVQCERGYAILRCAPGDIERTVDLMHETVPGSVSISTSGTLRALRSRIPELGRPTERKR